MPRARPDPAGAAGRRRRRRRPATRTAPTRRAAASRRGSPAPRRPPTRDGELSSATARGSDLHLVHGRRFYGSTRANERSQMADGAQLEQTPSGLAPADRGWFVVNVRDTAWTATGDYGARCRFENRDVPFEQIGMNIRVLQPGQPNCLYHAESPEEHFLVLYGECLLLVEEEERP